MGEMGSWVGALGFGEVAGGAGGDVRGMVEFFELSADLGEGGGDLGEVEGVVAEASADFVSGHAEVLEGAEQALNTEGYEGEQGDGAGNTYVNGLEGIFGKPKKEWEDDEGRGSHHAVDVDEGFGSGVFLALESDVWKVFFGFSVEDAHLVFLSFLRRRAAV